MSRLEEGRAQGGRARTPAGPREAALLLAAALLLLAAAAPGLAPRSEAAAREAPRAAGAAGLLFGRALDPNRAAAADLEALPGIGPGRAAAIVAAREREPFCAVDELVRAHGIGPHTLGRAASGLAIDPLPVGCVGPGRASGAEETCAGGCGAAGAERAARARAGVSP